MASFTDHGVEDILCIDDDAERHDAIGKVDSAFACFAGMAYSASYALLQSELVAGFPDLEYDHTFGLFDRKEQNDERREWIDRETDEVEVYYNRLIEIMYDEPRAEGKLSSLRLFPEINKAARQFIYAVDKARRDAGLEAKLVHLY